MDPAIKIWMFYNWIEDQKDKYELAKQHGILVGSFTNPEMAAKMSGGGTTFKSSDEEFDESTNMVIKEREKEEEEKPKRKRRRLIKG